MAMLNELRVLGVDDLRDLVGLYFTDVEAQLARAHDGLDEGNGETVAAAAHRLKGASLSIGAARVATLAADLEVAGRQGDLVDCGDMLATLEGELDPTKLALNAELAVGSIG
jgi:HPt (histidine-containing phosphotransfer) domain-containing protein